MMQVFTTLCANGDQEGAGGGGEGSILEFPLVPPRRGTRADDSRSRACEGVLVSRLWSVGMYGILTLC